jgi:prevent-host-death family protein
MTTVGAYEAKTHLSRLLDEVAEGKTVTITRHGHDVARIVPVSARTATSARDAAAALREARKCVRRGRTSVRAMIAEGRR